MADEAGQDNNRKYMIKKFVMGLALVCDGGAGADGWDTGIGEGEGTVRSRVAVYTKIDISSTIAQYR